MAEFVPRTVLYKHMGPGIRPEPVSPEVLAKANAWAKKAHDLRVTLQETQEALDGLVEGCDHSAFHDTAGDPYNIRWCGTCGCCVGGV